MKKKYERYFAADINGLIYANIVYYKLNKGTLGCYSGFASSVFQLKYFFISGIKKRYIFIIFFDHSLK